MSQTFSRNSSKEQRKASAHSHQASGFFGKFDEQAKVHMSSCTQNDRKLESSLHFGSSQLDVRCQSALSTTSASGKRQVRLGSDVLLMEHKQQE